MTRDPASLTDTQFSSTLVFDNAFVRELPGDTESGTRSRQVYGAAYSRVMPTAVQAPTLIAYSREVAAMVGFSEADLRLPLFAEVFGGNAQIEGMEPYAANYGGHQFGQWAGQLGDGRAITLAEVINGNGERWELQLKGAGQTPYSRRADGRAVLRSSVREFLCSEAMHHLGVPTTRALSLVLTGDQVLRDMFYDGNAQFEPGAIVCRVAPSFIRFGNFQLPASRGDVALLNQLIDFTIRRDFRELADSGSPGDPAIRAEWFAQVCERTARMVAEWMRVGFVHGVMNTDNMSILGLTIDYGPYGWLEGYDPTWTPNTTDAGSRRYRYGQQPNIALWNLARFGEALAPLVDTPDDLHRGLEVYRDTFDATYRATLRDKLGLDTLDTAGRDPVLVELFALLEAEETDMTLFFRNLAHVPVHEESSDEERLLAPLRIAFYDAGVLDTAHRHRLIAWLRAYGARVRAEGRTTADRVARMQRANPKYVLRNYLAQQAIDAAAQGDASVIDRLLDVLSRPYDDQPEHDDLAQRRPEWARHRAGCSMLSCSS